MIVFLWSAILASAFVLGEGTVLGTILWLADQRPTRRRINLGTLVLGLLSVPVTLIVMTFMAGGP